MFSVRTIERSLYTHGTCHRCNNKEKAAVSVKYSNSDKIELMDSNIWFYTFSTLAQSMAALVGLFALFVVYKIQDFSGLLSQVREAVIEMVANYGANTRGYQKVLRVQDAFKLNDDEILVRMNEIIEILETDPQRVTTSSTARIGAFFVTMDRHSFQFYKNLVTKRELILQSLRRVLILSLSCIAVSILALAMTKWLVIFSCVIWATTLFFLFCLFEIGRGIYKITTK